MVKQHHVEITYNDNTTEEFIIHSNTIVEWIEETKEKTSTALIQLLATANQTINWCQLNAAKKVEITEEDEE